MVDEKKVKRRKPANTPEGRERQIIASAMNLAENMILDGSASSQIITHFLKLGTTKNELELEKLRNENELLRAKAEAIESGKKIEELYEQAALAIKGYQGRDDEYDILD